MKVAFVCIQNAGRSQIATAFAKRERARRGLEDDIEIVTGGTRPAISVHDVVIDVMDERGIDLRDRIPRKISKSELADCEYVVAMGCTAEGVCPAAWSETSIDWGLDDPDAMEFDAVRELRDDVEVRVEALFDEMGP